MSELIKTDAAGTPEVIAWFDDFQGPNPYSALSNFFIGEPIYIPETGDEYMTGEHAYQAMKAWGNKIEGQYDAIRYARDPGTAKMHGNTCRLRSDWESVKYDVMMAILRTKFTLSRPEGDILLSTGDALLVEGTFWGDRVWGVDLEVAPMGRVEYAPGRNWLGTMLMARRAELRAESYFDVSMLTARFNSMFATGD